MKKRLLTVVGNDHERGYQIGTQLERSIKVNYLNQIRHYKEMSGYDFTQWVESCKKYIPLVQKYTPHTYAELCGMADGAKMPFEQILALTSAYELAVTGGNIADKCTGFSVAGNYTDNGGAICGQTNDEDFSEWIPYLDAVLRHKASDGPSALIYTHPGIAAYMGMNDAGISILWQYIDNGERAFGVPTNCIIREVLFYSELDDVINFLNEVPHAIPNHYLITHKNQGKASVECYPSGVFVKKSLTNICHANNILTPEKINGCDKKNPLIYRNPFSVSEMEKEAYEGALNGIDGVLEWSYVRYDTICKLVDANKGKINVDIAKQFLSDHTHEPFSICSHPNFVNTRWKTLASIVFDMEQAHMHIAFGSACETDFYEFSFED